MKQLNSNRLVLRPYAERDYEVLKETWLDYMSTHKEIEKDDLLVIDNWIIDFASKEYCWVAEEKNSGETIGNINVIKTSKKHNFCEVAYAVKMDARRKGYATEMLKAVISYLLYEEGFHIVEASYYSGNPNSGKVMKKAGMQMEAKHVDRKYNFKTKQYENLIYYYAKSY